MASSLVLHTCAEAAVLIGVSPIRVRKFCQEGRLGQKIGDQWLITDEEIRLFKQIPRKRGRPRSQDTAE